jgi:hypothetical protein
MSCNIIQVGDILIPLRQTTMAVLAQTQMSQVSCNYREPNQWAHKCNSFVCISENHSYSHILNVWCMSDNNCFVTYFSLKSPTDHLVDHHEPPVVRGPQFEKHCSSHSVFHQCRLRMVTEWYNKPQYQGTHSNPIRIIFKLKIRNMATAQNFYVKCVRFANDIAVFGRYLVRISARATATMTCSFVVFLANSDVRPSNRPPPLTILLSNHPHTFGTVRARAGSVQSVSQKHSVRL